MFNSEEKLMSEEQKSRTTMLVPNRFGQTEHIRMHFTATVESGEHPEDFLRPDFWSLVAKDVQPLSIIEVRSEDGLYWGEYLVRSCDRTWIKTALLREHKFDIAEKVADSADEFTVEWKGPHRKWCVIRNSDKSLVHEGEQEKIGAINWLDGYAKTVGASIKKAA